MMNQLLTINSSSDQEPTVLICNYQNQKETVKLK